MLRSMPAVASSSRRDRLQLPYTMLVQTFRTKPVNRGTCRRVGEYYLASLIGIQRDSATGLSSNVRGS